MYPPSGLHPSMLNTRISASSGPQDDTGLEAGAARDTGDVPVQAQHGGLCAVGPACHVAQTLVAAGHGAAVGAAHKLSALGSLDLYDIALVAHVHAYRVFCARAHSCRVDDEAREEAPFAKVLVQHVLLCEPCAL